MKSVFSALGVVIIGLFTVSCSNDKDSEPISQPVSLSCESLKTCLRGGVQSIIINGGSGGFTVSVNGDAVEASCDNRTIAITPLTYGNAWLTVTDAATGSSAKCDVSVGESYATFLPTSINSSFIGKNDILYMRCDEDASPRQWFIISVDGTTQRKGTFTTSYVRDETVTVQGQDYYFSLFSLNMDDGNGNCQYTAADGRTFATNSPVWPFLFSGTGWSNASDTGISSPALSSRTDFSPNGANNIIVLYDQSTDLMNPSVSFSVGKIAPLP